ncbi:MAG: alpha/beta hydrolase [Alphaproteobacteria bacterium]|nr:alpha/beta hydrolase [Alphaproteobacteria bacterium]
MIGRPAMLWILAALGALSLVVVAGCASGAGRSSAIEDAYPPTGRFIEVSGTRLHYEITGPEDAPAVLVLHGASGNLHEPKLALADVFSGYRAIWLDRPGLGWSERPQGGGAWTPEREAALIDAFLAGLGQDEVYVVGHSWGGAIALRLLMDQPDRAVGAVLIAPAARANVGDAAFYNTVTGWPVIGTIMTRAIVPAVGPGSLGSGSTSAFAPVEPPENYVERTRLPLILRPGPWRNNAADMARVNTSLEEQQGRYGEIAQPIIIVAAPGDTVLLTDRHSGPLVETVQNGELRLIEGEGHNPHHGHPGAIAQALADVIERAGR